MVLAAVLALTLYLPLMAGQLSVASPGFYALGGYVAAILSTKVFHPGPGLYPVSLVLVEMVVAAVLSGILGLVVGVPALRLRGIFLALATIAFVQILGVVALNLEITDGAIGIFGIPQPRAHRLRRARHQRDAPERRGPPGHRPGSGGPPHARPPERARQPAARRLHALGRRRDPDRRRAAVRALSPPGRAATPDGRHVERRRATDAGDRPRPDEPAPPAAARRAVAGAGAAD